jgi:hypothetical protein
MRLSHLTLTGADDAVDPAALAQLSTEFPLIEWGLLLSAEYEGRPRFPSGAWREAFFRAAPGARCAAHVCGVGLLRAVARQALLGPYGRMQLNFEASRLPAGLLDDLVRARRVGGPVWITQHNEANRGVHGLFDLGTAPPRHAVLFDESGGRGLRPSGWPAALPDIDCGYAGGLGPENLVTELPRIAAAAGRRLTWIDMEGGLRTGDRFDLARARAVCEAVSRAAGGAPLVPGVEIAAPADEGPRP